MSKPIINKLEIVSDVFPCIKEAADGDVFEVACVGCVNQGVTHDDSCNCEAQAVVVEFELRNNGILLNDEIKTFLLSRNSDVIILGVMADIISGRNILRYNSHSCSDSQLMTILGGSVVIKVVCNEDIRGLEVVKRERKDKSSLYYYSSVDTKLNYGKLPSKVEGSLTTCS